MVWKWVRWLLPSPTPRLEDHVSIWSIRARDAGTFFRLFATPVAVVSPCWCCFARIAITSTEHADGPLVGWQNTVDFALAVLGNVGIGTAMLAMMLTRPANRMGGIAMSLYGNCEPIRVIEKHKAESVHKAVLKAVWEQAEELDSVRRRVEAKRQGRDFGRPLAGSEACICVYLPEQVSGERRRGGLLQVDERGRATGEAEGTGHGALFGPFLRGASPRAPRLKAVFLRGLPPREGFLARAAPSRSPAEGSVPPPCCGACRTRSRETVTEGVGMSESRTRLPAHSHPTKQGSATD